MVRVVAQHKAVGRDLDLGEGMPEHAGAVEDGESAGDLVVLGEKREIVRD